MRQWRQGDLIPEDSVVRAALYLRASTEYQQYSTSNQLDALSLYAANNGLTVVAIYEDDGRSGLDLHGRPALRRLLADVLERPQSFDTLLVLDVSRWGRFQDIDEAAYYEFLCRKAGVQVVYCAEPFGDIDNPITAVLKSIKRIMAAEYSRELSRKISVGKRRICREGFTQGGPAPFGMQRQMVSSDRVPKALLAKGEYKSLATDRVVLVPGAPENIGVVQEIYRLCADENLGVKQIANRLNCASVPGITGGLWTSTVVKTVLRNEKYVGVNVYGRTVGLLKKPRRSVGPEQWLRCEGAFTPIISRDLYDRAQAMMGSRRKARDGSSEQHMLGLLAALYNQHGYLSGPLIDSQPDMPKAQIYKWRFRGLLQAFRHVGYQPPKQYGYLTDKGPQTLGAHDHSQLLDQLRSCLERHGRLSAEIIDNDPAMPSCLTYRWAFGGLAQAYSRIHYEPVHWRLQPVRRVEMPASAKPIVPCAREELIQAPTRSMPRKANSQKPARRATFIRAWRKHRDLTLAELRDHLSKDLTIEISEGQLSRIERGETPYGQDILEALSAALNCEPADLIAREPGEPEFAWTLVRDLKPDARRKALEMVCELAKAGRAS